MPDKQTVFVWALGTVVQGGAASLTILEQAFNDMKSAASVEDRKAISTAITHAVDRAPEGELTSDQRAAVLDVLGSVFDGTPRKTTAVTVVNCTFLTRVSFDDSATRH
jgi:hypothetical protein